MQEINAEMLLEKLYPELEQLWVAHHKGTFYRNYSPDAMSIYNKEHLVEVSRDGILKRLPMELLSPSWELDEVDQNGKRYRKSKETRYAELRARLHLLSEAFLPIDTFRFRARLTVERHVEQMLDLKLWYVLKTYYDFDLHQEHDELVTEVAMLLPFMAKLRGNVDMVATILHTVTGYKVRKRQTAFSTSDNSKYWMPKLHFEIIIPGLTVREYKKQKDRLTPLIEFVKEHLVPFDVFCDIEIKDSSNSAASSTPVELLNYNTHVQ